MIFFIIFLAVLLLIFSRHFLFGIFRQQGPNEPPLDKGPLPWLGHALEFKKDIPKFLLRMQRKHGDIFTVQLGGYYFTYLMDPFSFGGVVKESKTKLDFETFAKDLILKVFGYQSIENEHKLLMAASNKHLMGKGLEVTTQATMENLQYLMLPSDGNWDNGWKHDGLFNYSFNITLRAGYLALFGSQFQKTMTKMEKKKEFDHAYSENIYCIFRKFDKMFPELVYGVLSPARKKEADRLKNLLCKSVSFSEISKHENASFWITEQMIEKASLGIPECMLDKNLLMLLWVSQGNTGPTAFWLLLFLMKYPDAMKAVREEVFKILKETGQEVKPGGPLVNLTKEMLSNTPVLDSAVNETLRMTAAPILTRAVMENMTLKMSDGREYFIHKGDRLALFPYLAVQMDSDVYPDPYIFKFHRFLNADGTKKTEFYKNNKRLKYFNMPWGAGVSICPGRFFAINELKQFAFLMLAYFECELVNPEQEIPPISSTRWGLGSTQPINDVQFKYRLRC
ncbi:5-beta-cholestane-3-alpha,7-alpha-diol 12-alpha-hydroxylase-like [Protopterus annectens]|uniref:5-beta-cholestane-3-alpha,7-alpha-diol 12-alpha-hydroxylase-like n=1 Tax=Protopterus annectens TaxID=7888 RepID=UPI001CFAFD95|nr:5-beta-cholestane-3-alpha,7-alpha-diol 12-alpha-hydroxylase-like [Protopterus annectens]